MLSVMKSQSEQEADSCIYVSSAKKMNRNKKWSRFQLFFTFNFVEQINFIYQKRKENTHYNQYTCMDLWIKN